MAGVTGPLRERRLVAAGASVRPSFLAVIHRKTMRQVVLAWLPGVGGVAEGTGLAGEHSKVINGVGMASGTFGWCAGKHAVLVALFAGCICVRAGQRKGAL